MERMDTGELRGRRVIDSKGALLGNVRDVVIDPQSWHVSGLVVEVERDVANDLNLEKPVLAGRSTLEIATTRVGALGDAVLLNVDRDTIAALLRQP